MIAFLTGSEPAFDPATINVEIRRLHARDYRFVKGGGFVCLGRHGIDGGCPPHLMPTAECIAHLAAAGCTRFVGFYSTGSLRADLTPGKAALVGDYIDLWSGATSFDGSKPVRHVTPSVSPGLSDRLREAAAAVGLPLLPAPVIYAQTLGPRLETRAEVALLSRFADVVGMTAGREFTLAAEHGLPCAGLALIDNFAHGVAGHTPSTREIAAAKSDFSLRAAGLIRTLAAAIQEAP